MRKRSDIGQPVATQSNLGDAPGAGAPATTAPAAVTCAKCSCKQLMTTMERSGWKCVKCGADVPRPQAAQDPPVGQDPWKLNPGSVPQNGAQPSVATNTNVVVHPQSTLAPGQPLGGEIPIVELQQRLTAKGLTFDLADLAKWPTLFRVQAAEWAIGKLQDPPAHLRPYLVLPRSHVENAQQPPAAPLVAQVPIPQTPKLPPKQKQQSSVGGESEGMVPTVRYSWGEESITPKPGSYSTCKVGPFEAWRELEPDESAAQALASLRDEVVAFAEAERERKLKSFVAAYARAVQAVAGAN